MTRFILNLDEGASDFHEALIVDAMRARFPEIEFIAYTVSPLSPLASSAIPLVGRPHPTIADCTIMEPLPDAALREEVQEALEEVIPEAMGRVLS